MIARVSPYLPTRDSVAWIFGFVSALGVFLLAHFELLVRAFGLTSTWQARIELVAVLAGFIAAKLSYSPLPRDAGTHLPPNRIDKPRD